MTDMTETPEIAAAPAGPLAKGRRKRRRRSHVGSRSAPHAEILPPEAVLADEAPLVAADADDSLPPDLEFEPVPRRARSNGLTPQRQRLFIKFLAATGSVHAACRSIGCSEHAVYNLRQCAGADSFAHAWERAVERGARRVRDVLLDQSINGIPETIYKDGEIVAERRVFNTRAQMWVAAHYMPERFGVGGGLMHGSGTPVNMKRLKDQWREEQIVEDRTEIDQQMAEMMFRIHSIRSHFKERIANDPARRAAWELLVGPTDWTDFDAAPDYGHGGHPLNQNRPDIIVTMAAPLGPNGEPTAEALFALGYEEDEEA